MTGIQTDCYTFGTQEHKLLAKEQEEYNNSNWCNANNGMHV